MNIFQRAHQRLPLSPEERALLKFVYLSVMSAALTGGVAAGQYVVANNHNINWPIVWTVFIGAFTITLGESIRKWWTAHNDGPMSAATQLLTAAIQKAAATPAATSSSPSSKESVK